MWGREVMYVEFLQGNLKEKDHSEAITIEGDNIKMDFKEMIAKCGEGLSGLG